jgi:AraC-like DNA-binding protein
MNNAAPPIRLGQIPTASGLMTRLAYAQAKTRGVALEPLLKASGFTQRQVEDPHLRVGVRAQIKFVNLVADTLKDEFLGFHIAQLPDLREIGLLYYAMASSETMIDALRRGARYSSIVNEGIAQKCVDGSDVQISLHYVGVSRHLDRHQAEFRMTMLVRICRQLAGLRLLPIRLRLSHLRKSGCPEFAEYFGDDIEFGAPVDEITFAKRIRDLHVGSADPYLNELLVRYCEEALSQVPGRRGSFRASVENAIAPLLPHGSVAAKEIARRLGVSQRTFARRLSLEGLTFSRLLENLRFELANRYLAEQTLSISELAWLLGYREVASFSNAFRRWTGKTPREARSHLVGDDVQSRRAVS